MSPISILSNEKNLVPRTALNMIVYFYFISDRFKILKRSKKPTSHVADHSLAASLSAAALVLHINTLSQSSEHLLTQSEKLQTTESEGKGRFGLIVS